MDQSIGERIKTLRKELKLTQTELAGTEMTKSMLSQIENNQATPSMKSLQYLAKKLGKPLSFFIDGTEYSSNKPAVDLPVENINKQLNEIISLIKKQEYFIAQAKLEDLINSYEYDRSSKLYADIIFRYGQCLISLEDFDKGEEYIRLSVDIYMSQHLFAYAARANMELMGRCYSDFQYDKCLNILDESLDMYKHAVNPDNTLEVEMLYYRALMKLANASAEEVLALIQEALDISKETGTYYNSDELYRLKAYIYFIMEKFDDFKFCIEKAKQFAEFTDNHINLAKIEILLALYENTINNPHNALEHLKKCDMLTNKKRFNYYMNLAYANYLLGDYEAAYEAVENIEYNSRSNHKVDYLTMWTGKVYEGLILHKLHKPEEAFAAINTAIEKLRFFGPSKYLAFAFESLANIYAELNDYKPAYESICEAYNIRISLQRQGKIAF
ncbi:helix-turn-helix domain-containing protein [Clostridium thermarum]|uniref:helix-turn-helix domain-containing protein n=1 Tax=Clostridium thermarum TaxID=1716543 RepID=UPI00111E00E2|nr:helix-turn-helix transcriptional regulator [Clostridium thermarum]